MLVKTTRRFGDEFWVNPIEAETKYYNLVTCMIQTSKTDENSFCWIVRQLKINTVMFTCFYPQTQANPNTLDAPH